MGCDLIREISLAFVGDIAYIAYLLYLVLLLVLLNIIFLDMFNNSMIFLKMVANITVDYLSLYDHCWSSMKILLFSDIRCLLQETQVVCVYIYL